jgi:hypothetical protein
LSSAEKAEGIIHVLTTWRVNVKGVAFHVGALGELFSRWGGDILWRCFRKTQTLFAVEGVGSKKEL